MILITLRSASDTRLDIAKSGKSLRNFCKDIGVSQGYVSQILCEKKNPSPTVAYKIAKGLNKEIEDIFFVHLD